MPRIDIKNARRLPCLILAVILLALSDRVLAQQPGASDTPAATLPAARLTLTTALRKAALFETATSVSETAVFMAYYGGAAAEMGTVFVTSLFSSGLTYIVHEYAWDGVIQGQVASSDPGLIAAKTLSYRMLSTLRSFVIGSVLGAPGLFSSVGFALTVAAADTLLYIGNELWFASAAPR